MCGQYANVDERSDKRQKESEWSERRRGRWQSSVEKTGKKSKKRKAVEKEVNKKLPMNSSNYRQVFI
ncbi:hypothetical protein E2C01_043390 [Portunus trituberculatus]|uniref:Uncharacterized protein n=1 Tax=Portunus trituberculatus TaxID=210409 RepID=A0A5B7FX73_PORTR|nr:hypothetical protein [Portunus trituberculatus]